MKSIFSILLLFCFGITIAQTTISGTVLDDSSQPIPSANVIIVGTATGTSTDFDGNFNLTTDQTPPFTIQISSIGFTSIDVEVTSNKQKLEIVLQEGTSLDEVVISASRTPERIFESPVTVERFGLKEIKNTASADFYGGLENLKGVDINTNSLTFKSINTRGFATFANTRFMQLVDGMDNSAPALNFPLGNLLGMTETDVKSVELLPGASSALYGANAFNGILFMTSKSPFDDQGISAYVKKGVTNQESSGENAYTDLGIRMAYKFSDKFAAKVNFGYLKGTDWAATSEEDKLNRGLTREDYDYDGINVYGDEVSTNIRAASGLGFIPNVEVSRTGYNERDLTEYNAESIKADWGLYFRPITDSNFEIAYVGKIGSGNTIYQGANRYNIKNFFLQQHKIEVSNDNYFVRAYVTEDKAGDSYDMVFTGININRAWKSDTQWFQEYIQTFAGLTLSNPLLTDAQKHASARGVADTGRYLPGSPDFKKAFNESINNPDLSTGSKFQDNSKIYHADGNYNFADKIDFAEIQVGASYRRYNLNSSGTIYTDFNEAIDYSEIGFYTQLQKEIELKDNIDLKLTGSLRYDKSELFDGFFSPRLSAGFTINKNHNIRTSFQTGFRNPTTQDLFIGLDVGRAILIGGAEGNGAKYVRNYGVSAEGQLLNGGSSSVTLDGSNAYQLAYSKSSVNAYEQSVLNGTPDTSLLEETQSNLAKPEQVTSVEVGYRGKVKSFILDASVYYNSYKNFLSNENVVVTYYGETGDGGLSQDAIRNGDYNTYQNYTNSEAKVNSFGTSIGANRKIFKGFDAGVNYTYAKLDFDQAANPDFRTNFNTPEHKVKATFGKDELFKNFGFNVAWRWSDDFFWESSFGDGAVPAYHTLDAQVNYRIPSLKTSLKVGATNMLGDEYFTAFGTGFIGSLYYASITINNL
jgi:outer membrane receptor protein involved in Fe transport